MKIGVITYTDSRDNYGQILQAYAMQKYLELSGHTPFLIIYQAPNPRMDFSRNKENKFKRYLKRLPYYISLYFQGKRKRKARIKYFKIVDFDRRNFKGFRNKFFNCLGPLTPDEIRQLPPEADAYICGSDQIWFPGNDDAFFLSFVPKGKLKIAYAPSFGGIVEVNSLSAQRLSRLISDFDAIGMRESSGQSFCEILGRKDTVKVPDPTLLLEREEYDTLASIGSSDLIPNKKYALIYLIGHITAIPFKKLEKYIQSRGWEMVYVATQGRADLPFTANPTPSEWLRLIKGAEIVITNSFHCLVFSLIFHKNFIAVPMAGPDLRNNDRLVDILKECGLEDRIAWKNLPQKTLKEDDFRKFEAYRKTQFKTAEDFLRMLDTKL